MVKYGTVRPGSHVGEDAGFTFGAVYPYYTTMWQGMAGARYYFSPEAGSSPSARPHLGFIDWKVRDESGNDGTPACFPAARWWTGYTNSWDPKKLESMNLTTTLGLGLEYFFSETVALEAGRPLHLHHRQHHRQHRFGHHFRPRRGRCQPGHVRRLPGPDLLLRRQQGQGRRRHPEQVRPLPR